MRRITNMEIKLIQKETDPICTRVSIGGKAEIGYYGVYRGGLDEAIECVEIVLKELRRVQLMREAELNEGLHDLGL